MTGRIKYDVMSDKELALFKDRMEQLLMKRGIHLNHPELKAELAAAGCEVDGDHVRFTKAVIDKALSTVPSEFTLYAPDEAYNMQFPHPEQSFYTRTCTGAPYYRTVDGDQHYITLDDTSEWFHLVNNLEHINYVALPSTCDPAVPGEAIDVYTLEKALQISRKHIWIQPYEAANTKYLIEMCAAAAGGYDKLREKPIGSGRYSASASNRANGLSSAMSCAQGRPTLNRQ